MPDNQPTPPVEVQQKDPSPGGVPFTPANDEMVSAFNDTKRREFLDQQKPKSTGDAMALGLAKDLLQKKSATEGVGSNDNNLKNRMISIKGDLVNDINAQTITPPEDPKDRDKLKEQEADFNRNIASRYDISQKDIKEGTILPVPTGYKSDQFDVIGTKNPAWTKKYIQLRKDPTTGEMSWQGYNYPSTMEGQSEVAVASTRFKDDGATKTINRETGLALHVPTAKVKGFWEKERNSVAHEIGDINATHLLKNQESKNNYRLTIMMENNPKLWKSFKAMSGRLTSQDFNDEGIARTLQSAITETYGLDKSWTDVIKHTPEYDIRNAINQWNDFSTYSENFNKAQNNLASKIVLTAQPSLYAANPKVFDRLHELEGQLLRDPKSLSADDKKEYNKLLLGIASSVADLTKDSPISKAFKDGAVEYNKRLKKAQQDAIVLGTEDGKAALTFMEQQAHGSNLMARVTDYLPSYKRSEQEQKKLNETGDWLSSFKAFSKNALTTFQDVQAMTERWLGVPEWVAANHLIDNNIKVPEREGKTTTDKIANVVDGFFGFVGGIGPHMIATLATGGASAEASLGSFMLKEGIGFGLQGMNSGYRRGKLAGLSESESTLMGALTGVSSILGQRLVPKGKMFSASLVNKEIDNLVSVAAKRPERILNFVKSFYQSGESGVKAIALTEGINATVDTGFNIAKGKDFKSEGLSVDNILSQGMMFGAMGAITHTLSSFGDQRAARAMVVEAAERHPQMVLTALHNANTMSVIDDSYNPNNITLLNKAVADHLSFSYNKDMSPNSRKAVFDIHTQIQELQSEKLTVDKILHPAYDEKIKEMQEKLKKVATNDEDAKKHMDTVLQPIYDHLEKQGYFDKSIVPKEAPKPVEPKEGGPVMVRHAQSTSNEKGLGGNPNDPLTAEGERQASELGVKLKNEGVVNVIASPAERSQQTADHITHETGGDVTTLDDLAEWNTGHGDKPVADFDAKHWVNNPDEKPADGAESFNEFLDRVQRARGDIEGLNKETAVVTHGKVLKLMTALDNNGGEWNAKAKAEFLNGKEFENAEPHRDGKPMKAEKPVEMSEEEKVKADINDKIANRHGFKYEELVKNMQKEKLLKIRCPAGGRSTPRGSKMVKSMSSL